MCTYIVLGIIALYLIYVFTAACVITETAVHPKANTYESEIEILKGFGYDCRAFLNECPCTGFSCKSEYGYDLHGRIFRLEGSSKAVVLCHGYGGNSTTMLSYARVFRNLGYSVVVYDHRNFGINEKTFTSFGLYESCDLVTVFNYVKTVFPSETKWGVMGESMGGATVMMALADLKSLSFAVDDCGFCEMKTVLSIKNPLPSLGSIPLCNLFLKKKYGFTMNRVLPAKRLELADENLPMLFIYSKTDQTVPFWMYDVVYNSKKGNKKSWIIEDCRHAKAIFNFTEQYEKQLGDFFTEYGI